MNFRELLVDLVVMTNSISLLLNTINSSPTADVRSWATKPEVCMTLKKEIIPEVDNLKKENQSWMLTLSTCKATVNKTLRDWHTDIHIENETEESFQK